MTNSEIDAPNEKSRLKALSPSDLVFVYTKPEQLHLTSAQMAVIAESLPRAQNIIHYGLWCDIRYNKKEIQKCLSLLCGNMITIYQSLSDDKSRKQNEETVQVSTNDKKKKGKDDKKKPKTEEEKSEPVVPIKKKEAEFPDKITKLAQFILKDLEFIAYSKDKEVLLKTKHSNVRYLNDETNSNLKFAQMVYRNYSINFVAFKGVEFAELRSVDMSLFPEIEIYLSPSQRFQILYYALCVEYDAIYHQEVVRFVHSLVLSGVSIVDISKLPFDMFGRYEKGYDLRPIFQALSMMNFVCGICCSNTVQPDLIDHIQYLFHESSKMKILHLVNCGMTTGIKQLFESITDKSGSNLRYLNFRGNKLDDIEFLVPILRKSKAPLLFLDLSETGLVSKTAIEIFDVLKKYPTLQQLYIAEIETSDAVFHAFNEYLDSISSNIVEVNLHSLDLSKTENVKGFLKALNDHPMISIISLKIADLEMDQEASQELQQLIAKSITLRELDLSGTKITAENVADIISAISKNKKLHHFRLLLNSLDLKTGNLLPIFRVFLDGNLNRWDSLSLNSNHMDETDLRNIIPLLKMMKKLRSLSLSDNFNKEMKQIDDILVQLTEIPNLKRLTITGGPDNKLGAKIIPLFKKIRTTKHITEVDFSGNDGGDDFYTALVHILRTENTLQRLSIDGNTPASLDLLSEMSKAVKNSTVISFDFPLKDSSTILQKFNESELKAAVSRVSSIQLALLDAINANRARMNMMANLPFETTHEIRKLVLEITEEMRSQFVSNEKPLVHSCFCEEYGLPLPFQNLGDLVSDGGKSARIPGNTKKYKCYLSYSLLETIEEDPAHLLIPDPKNIKLPNTSSSSDLEPESDDSDLEPKQQKKKEDIINNNNNSNNNNKDEQHQQKQGQKEKDLSDLENDENKKVSRDFNLTKSKKEKERSESSDDEKTNKKKHNSKKSINSKTSSKKEIIEDDSEDENKKNDSRKSSLKKKNSSKKQSSLKSKRTQEDESSSEETPVNKKKSSKKHISKKRSNSSSDEEDEENDVNMKKKSQKTKRAARRANNNDEYYKSDEYEENDEQIDKKNKKKTESNKVIKQKHIRKSKEYDEDDDDDEFNDENEKKPHKNSRNIKNSKQDIKGKGGRNSKNRKRENEYESSSEELDKKDKKKKQRKDSYGSQDEEAASSNNKKNLSQKKKQKQNIQKKQVNNDDFSSDDDDTKDKKKKTKQTKNKYVSYSSDDDIENIKITKKDHLSKQNNSKKKESGKQLKKSYDNIDSDDEDKISDLKKRNVKQEKPLKKESNKKKNYDYSDDSGDNKQSGPINNKKGSGKNVPLKNPIISDDDDSKSDSDNDYSDDNDNKNKGKGNNIPMQKKHIKPPPKRQNLTNTSSSSSDERPIKKKPTLNDRIKNANNNSSNNNIDELNLDEEIKPSKQKTHQKKTVHSSSDELKDEKQRKNSNRNDKIKSGKDNKQNSGLEISASSTVSDQLVNPPKKPDNKLNSHKNNTPINISESSDLSGDDGSPKFTFSSVEEEEEKATSIKKKSGKQNRKESSSSSPAVKSNNNGNKKIVDRGITQEDISDTNSGDEDSSKEEDEDLNLADKKAGEELDNLVDVSYKPDKAAKAAAIAAANKGKKVTRKPPPKLSPSKTGKK